ncbi:MAG: hypothetical protein ACREYB_09505 [Casimicrobiaceae bacterium]
MKPTMAQTQPRKPDTGIEPAPEFASDAEIALAERLRIELEERYFGRPVTPLLSRVRPDKER